jgi:pantoate--beta-alanine ligase
MVLDLDWGIEIVTCPIIREADGLAMSSRNRYLSTGARQTALVLHRALTRAAQLAADSGKSAAEIENEMQQLIAATEGVELKYAVVRDTETLETVGLNAEIAVALLAARVGDTRLIDNQILRFRPTA